MVHFKHKSQEGVVPIMMMPAKQVLPNIQQPRNKLPTHIERIQRTMKRGNYESVKKRKTVPKLQLIPTAKI